MLKTDKGEKEEKEKKSTEEVYPEKYDFLSFINIEFLYSVTPDTKTFFPKFSISTDFLDKDPST